ncbi:MAG: hypothetical protein LKG21_07025 [Ruminococcus sp.]|jgi:hypothetical protein|nr:hypothetical protein [Ruminococcus sp.]
MSFVFISGKNNGYPCFTDLPDLSVLPISIPPMPSNTFTIPIGGGYPRRPLLQYVFPTSVTSSPYPVSVFRCLGENFNNGYPVKLSLSNISMKTTSSLFINEKNASELMFNSQFLSQAFCNGNSVYSVFYL